MKTIRAFSLGSVLLVGFTTESNAQFSLNIGNPYAGGISMGSPGYGYSSSSYSNYNGIGSGLGYSNNYNAYSTTGYLSGPGVIGGTYGYNPGYTGFNGYSSGYAGLNGYNPGYAGYANRGGYNSGVYQSRLYTGGNGYGGYGYGSRGGFAPFRPLNGFRRYP